MKQIPIQLQEAYRKPGGSYCYLAKVVDKNGDVHGFTSLDADYTFDDGIHVVRYSSRNELRPQRIQTTSDYDADTTELQGWFNKSLEAKIVAGMFDRAQLTVYRVAYLRPAAGAEVVLYGTVSSVEYADDARGKRKIEFVGLKEQLRQKVGEMYSLTCRAQYGDDRCKKPLVWFPGSVSAVSSSPYLGFTIAGVAQPAGRFDFGVIEFTSGRNAGAILEVETWMAGGGVQLSFLAPYPVQVNDQLRIREDCGKTEFDCKSKNNIINMRAEHLTPVENSAIMVPGAYVKSVGAE